MDSQTLVAQLRELGIWPEEPVAQTELLHLQQQLPDARALSRELLGRNLLTPYQANQLLTGKGQGLVVGPYQVLERLGEGATAQVFKARHVRLHRVAALKVIRKERLDNPVAVERFLREARSAAQLSHPNVVRAYDAAKVGETYYFAMEFVNGVDLARLVEKEGPVEVDRACDYARQAALGLQHIHDNGMVHRDVKPSNLMVERPKVDFELRVDDDTPSAADPNAPVETVKVLDLGLARLTEEAEVPGARPALTKVGTVMGTPDYISPEQALHSSGVDIRSDIYSLGCTLYFLLAGRPPFPEGDALVKMLKHQLEEPVPLHTLRQDVPQSVCGVLARMMAKKPDQRFQVPRDVAFALQAALDDRPAVAIPLRPLADPEAATILPPPSAPPADTATMSVPVDGTFLEEFPYAEVDTSPVIVAPPAPAPAELSVWIVLGCVGLVVGLGLLGALIAVLR